MPPPVFSICADCERHALRQPRRGKPLLEALACLTRLLMTRKRLQGLEVVRESCRHSCPLGKICVALTRDGQEILHHLGPQDDLKAVAARLAAPPKRS